VTVRLRRFLCAGFGRTETTTSWPSHCPSTPELDQLQAHLSALMPYRVAAGVLEHLLPVAAGTCPETLRSHTPKVGEHLRNAAPITPTAAASSITLSLDSTFIRSCHDGERHLEVRIGNVETLNGGRQVFGAVARADTDIAVLIRRNLETLGRTNTTELTAFTDGCPGLRSILTNAGGPGVLATDALMDYEGTLAELSPTSIEELDHILPRHWSHGNPVDVLGDASAERYAQAMTIALLIMSRQK